MQLSLHFQLQSWLLSFHNNFYSETKLSEFLFHTWASVLWICDNFRIVAIFSTETTSSSKYCWWQAKTESLTWVPVAKTRKITMILFLEQDLTGELYILKDENHLSLFFLQETKTLSVISKARNTLHSIRWSQSQGWKSSCWILESWPWTLSPSQPWTSSSTWSGRQDYADSWWDKVENK